MKELDKELDLHVEMCFKVKDRDLKKSIMQDIQECKNKTRQIMEVIRDTQGKMSNTQIAQLNDLAYRAVRQKVCRRNWMRDPSRTNSSTRNWMLRSKE